MNDLFAAVGPHLHWMLWCAILSILCPTEPSGVRLWIRRRDRMRASGGMFMMDVLIIGLAGILGLFLNYRPLLEAHTSVWLILPSLQGLFVLPWLLSRIVLKGFRLLSIFEMSAMCLVAAMVWGVTGGMGFWILIVCTAVGCIPVVYGTNRLGLVAFWLLPLAVRLSSWDTVVGRVIVGVE